MAKKKSEVPGQSPTYRDMDMNTNAGTDGDGNHRTGGRAVKEVFEVWSLALGSFLVSGLLSLLLALAYLAL